MKRTPLKPGRPLQRKTALNPGKALLRRCALNPVSAKRRQANQERRVVVNAMRLASDGYCPRCGLYGVVLHGHERLARAQGGDIVHPDVLICDPCNGAIEDDPRVSAWCGWKITPKWPHDPNLTISQARALDGSIVEFQTEAVA